MNTLIKEADKQLRKALARVRSIRNAILNKPGRDRGFKIGKNARGPCCGDSDIKPETLVDSREV